MRVRISIVLTAALLLVGCAGHARHVATVVDSSLYEALADTHYLEQQALCGQPSCAGVPEHPIAGWSHEQSVAFNKLLLPAVEGGRQFNALMATWTPGEPLPDEARATITGIRDALNAVVADFPDGSTKSQILASLGAAQAAALAALEVYLTVKGGGQ